MASGNQPATQKSNAAGPMTPEPMAPTPTVAPARFVRQAPAAPAFRFTGGPGGGPAPMAPGAGPAPMMPGSPVSQPGGAMQYSPMAPQVAPGGGFQAPPQQGYTVSQLAQQYSPFAGDAAQPAVTGHGIPKMYHHYETTTDEPAPVQPGDEPALVQPGDEPKDPGGFYEEADVAGWIDSDATYQFNPADPKGMSNEAFEIYFGMEGGPGFVTGDEARFQGSPMTVARTEEIREAHGRTQAAIETRYAEAYEIQRRRLSQTLASSGVAPGIAQSEQQTGLYAAFQKALVGELTTDMGAMEDKINQDIRDTEDQWEAEYRANEVAILGEVDAYIQNIVDSAALEGYVMDVRLKKFLEDQSSRFVNMGLDATHVQQYMIALNNEWRLRMDEDEYQHPNTSTGSNEAYHSGELEDN